MTKQNTAIIDALQREIVNQTKDLEDDDFIDVMEELASYCETCAEAKREEIGNEDDSEEDDDDD